MVENKGSIFFMKGTLSDHGGNAVKKIFHQMEHGNKTLVTISSAQHVLFPFVWAEICNTMLRAAVVLSKKKT